MPLNVSNVIWENLFEIYVQSNADDSIFYGSFNSSTQRRMQEINDKDPISLLAFEPSISIYNSSSIEIDFNFLSKKRLQTNEILTYGI